MNPKMQKNVKPQLRFRKKIGIYLFDYQIFTNPVTWLKPDVTFPIIKSSENNSLDN